MLPSAPDDLLCWCPRSHATPPQPSGRRTRVCTRLPGRSVAGVSGPFPSHCGTDVPVCSSAPSQMDIRAVSSLGLSWRKLLSLSPSRPFCGHMVILLGFVAVSRSLARVACVVLPEAGGPFRCGRTTHSPSKSHQSFRGSASSPVFGVVTIFLIFIVLMAV